VIGVTAPTVTLVTTPTTTTTTAVCADKPWVSEFGSVCADYASNAWCTSDGGYGSGWDPSWGSFQIFAATDGTSALEACCTCGGGATDLSWAVVYAGAYCANYVEVTNNGSWMTAEMCGSLAEAHSGCNTALIFVKNGAPWTHCYCAAAGDDCTQRGVATAFDVW
jgi:hypothetical protein